MGELGAQALWHVSNWILHVDLDQFQAAVEVRRNPELAGLPVIVGGNGDPTEPRKVVTCASYPAREFGVHAGMALRTAARKCPDAVFLPLDTDAYDDASEEVMSLLRDFGHPVEVWGWDEAYVGADLPTTRSSWPNRCGRSSRRAPVCRVRSASVTTSSAPRSQPASASRQVLISSPNPTG